MHAHLKKGSWLSYGIRLSTSRLIFQNILKHHEKSPGKKESNITMTLSKYLKQTGGGGGGGPKTGKTC